MKLPSKSAKKLAKDLNKFQISIILALIGLVLIGVGLSASNFALSSSEPKFIDAESEGSIEKITVDVSGAVENPGVYSFDVGTRMVAAIEEAGGFSENADKNYIASSLNLASKINDGEKIFIPARGSSTQAASNSSGGLININTASESELDTLYGIGPVRAEKIISNRPYSSIDELISKKVLGEATFERIKDQITTY